MPKIKVKYDKNQLSLFSMPMQEPAKVKGLWNGIKQTAQILKDSGVKKRHGVIRIKTCSNFPDYEIDASNFYKCAYCDDNTLISEKSWKLHIQRCHKKELMAYRSQYRLINN